MDLKIREQIFSKEVVTIADLMQLYELKYHRACVMMCELKHHGDRLAIKGRVHFEDYMQALKLKTNRYFILSNITAVQTPNKVIPINEFLQKEA